MNDLATSTASSAASGMTNVRWRIFLLILGTVAINYTLFKPEPENPWAR